MLLVEVVDLNGLVVLDRAAIHAVRASSLLERIESSSESSNCNRKQAVQKLAALSWRPRACRPGSGRPGSRPPDAREISSEGVSGRQSLLPVVGVDAVEAGMGDGPVSLMRMCTSRGTGLAQGLHQLAACGAKRTIEKSSITTTRPLAGPCTSGRGIEAVLRLLYPPPASPGWALDERCGQT